MMDTRKSAPGKQTPPISDGVVRFNRTQPATNVVFTTLMVVLGLCAVIPLVLVAIISISSEGSIGRLGYSFLPDELDFNAYIYLYNQHVLVLNGLKSSLIVTVIGTLLGLVLNATMGYVLSRRSYRLHGLMTTLIFIPMIFTGGMVSTYLVVSQFLGLRDSYFSLLLPIAVSSFYIIILRTFFTTTVPDSLIESARLDGASQLRTFVQIVLPISLPAIATIGLFLSFAYWNDWFQAMLYIDSVAKYPLQYLLVRIDRQITFLASNPTAISAGFEVAMKLPEESTRMAMVILIVLPIACSYPFFQRYFISGLTVGAVKG